jgi:hypothetical protein
VSLPQPRHQAADLNDVEMVPKAGKPYSGRDPVRSRRRFTSPPTDVNGTVVDPEDFTMTGNPALNTSIIGTIGTIASTLIKSLFGRGGGGGDDRAREGGGFMSYISSLFCRIFGGLFKPSGSGETCGSAGSDPDMLPANLTSQQMKMIEDYKEAMYDY